MSNMEIRKYSTKTWNEHPLHPKVADCRTVDWLVIYFAYKIFIINWASELGSFWLICLIFLFGVILMSLIRVFLTLIVMLSFIMVLLIQDIGLYVQLSIVVRWWNWKRVICWLLNIRFVIALDNDIPITNPSYYGSKASDEELAEIFKSDTKESCPMLSERIRVMREAGRVLCNVSIR